jgi:hypothetical protein
VFDAMPERYISIFISGKVCGELECLFVCGGLECLLVSGAAKGQIPFFCMLNEACVDIDEEPLGDYKNGHIGDDDAEDVEEAEGVDDELEEVDAGTYEDAASKKDHITRRTANYTEMEDEALIRPWDSVTGTDQTGKRYWQRIEDKFCHFMPRLAHRIQERTGHYKDDGMQSRVHVADGPLAWTKCGLHLRVEPPYMTM